ncbi:MAG: LUD domain-containing protein [Pseudomonadota bacterium]
MNNREAILAKVRQRLEGREGRVTAEAVGQRIASHGRNLIPKRGQIDAAAQVDLFEAKAKDLAASVVRVASDAEIPTAVADYLRSQNLPLDIKMAPDPGLRALPWQEEPLMKLSEGRAVGSDAVSLTPVAAGVAETGTLALTSGPETPTTLNFLPETHIAVLRASQVVGAYEEVFPKLRARFGEGGMPRTLNFVTGPSRTADIEQKIELGAHGPRRLHIILVEDS